MRPHLLLTTLLLSIIGNTAGAQEITHSFLACGQKTYIMGADGKPSWTYPAATRDGYVLEDGTVILTLNKSKRHRGGAVVSIVRHPSTAAPQLAASAAHRASGGGRGGGGPGGSSGGRGRGRGSRSRVQHAAVGL